MAYTFPLLNLTETDSFTKFCTKYLSDSNHTREVGLEMLLRRNGVGTQTRQILLHNSEHAQSVSDALK